MRAFLSLFLVGMVSMTFALFPRQDAYPPCTYNCLANATSAICQPGEVKCLCQDPAFINETTTCFQQSCSPADFAQAQKTAQDTCALAGVTLSSTYPVTASTSPTSGATAAGSSPSPTSPPSSSSKTPNSAGSTMVNIIGVAASLGLVALAL